MGDVHQHGGGHERMERGRERRRIRHESALQDYELHMGEIEENVQEEFRTISYELAEFLQSSEQGICMNLELFAALHYY